MDNDSIGNERMTDLEISIIRLLSRQRAQVHDDPSLEDKILSFYCGWPRGVFIDAVDEIICEDWRRYIDQAC